MVIRRFVAHLAFGLLPIVAGAVEVAELFSNGMILQREARVCVWGTGQAGDIGMALLRSWLQHKCHPLHIYCRLMDRAARALKIACRVYELTIYRMFLGGK